MVNIDVSEREKIRHEDRTYRFLYSDCMIKVLVDVIIPQIDRLNEPPL